MAKRKKKESKLSLNLMKIVQQYVSGRGYAPLLASELMQRLHLPPQHERAFTDVLMTLTEAGDLAERAGRYGLKETSNDVVTGILRVHPRGFGFLQTDKGKEDIFIPKHLTLNAVDGDRVEVLINSESISEKGPEGKVLAILERSRTHVAGIIKSRERGNQMIAYVPILGAQQKVIVDPITDGELRIGDRVVMEVVEWGSKETATHARVSHIIGHISDPSTDIPAAIEEYEIRNEFPSKVIQEAKTFKEGTADNREDLRDIEIFTIDPDTAKDFDDALNVQKDRRGHYLLGVHIADVSHYVRPGTALDEEAKLRCNSTYFPGRCVPMLPGDLSENLCSLREGVDRLTASVFMEFDQTGTLLNYRMARTIICSKKRFTYKEAKDVLDGKKKSPHLKTLRNMVDLCGLLKKKRYERGSIEFSIPSLMILVDEKGVPTGVEMVEYDVTHQMVEEFMLKANEMVATHLSNAGKPVPYRIHDEPAEDNLREFSSLARAFGFGMTEKPTPADLQALFDKAAETPHGQYLATSYIRSMRLAIYSPENVGHYGLGLTHYCHFTSPIRRYIDLVAHRILFNEWDEKDNLGEIARLCSEQERISAKAEGNVTLLKKLRLLQQVKEKNPHGSYEAVVTRVKPFGLFFDVVELMIEGSLHISELDPDFFHFNESKLQLRGADTGITYQAGARLTVMILDVDLIAAEARWSLVSDQQPRKKKA